MFVVVSFLFSFSLEEVAGFSTPAWASRQKGILAPFNPRVLEDLSLQGALLTAGTFWNTVPGVIAAVTVSEETPVGRGLIVGTCVQEKVGVLSKEKQTFTGARVPRESPYPRGNFSTELFARDSRGMVTSKYSGCEGWHHEVMRFFSNPGVLETLNPTDEGSFGKGRNTYAL